MEDWMGDAEIHFDKCHGGERQTSLKRWGKGLAVGCFLLELPIRFH